MPSRQILCVAFRMLLVSIWPVLWQIGIGERSLMAQTPKAAGKKLPEWVTMPDKAFCHQNFEKATGDQQQISSLIELLKPFGIKEVVRTGRVALARVNK